jgi:hypothetical protein
MSKATPAILDDLHGALAADMAKRLREGEKVVTKGADGEPEVTSIPVGAATLGQIRQFLKDNNVQVDATAGRQRFQSILEGLPFPGEEPGAAATH